MKVKVSSIAATTEVGSKVSALLGPTVIAKSTARAAGMKARRALKSIFKWENVWNWRKRPGSEGVFYTPRHHSTRLVVELEISSWDYDFAWPEIELLCAHKVALCLD